MPLYTDARTVPVQGAARTGPTLFTTGLPSNGLFGMPATSEPLPGAQGDLAVHNSVEAAPTMPHTASTASEATSGDSQTTSTSTLAELQFNDIFPGRAGTTQSLARAETVTNHTEQQDARQGADCAEDDLYIDTNGDGTRRSTRKKQRRA